MSFYIKKTYVDTQPGIELVNIHYTWTPVGQQPNWEAHRETRAMPRGGVLIKGLGGTTVAESGEYVQTLSQTVTLPDDGIRRKVIRLPRNVYDPARGVFVEPYTFHYCFEIFCEGKRELSPVYAEEIISKEVEYIDHTGTLGGMCIFWGVYDWDAAQYQPTEESRFIEKFGEDNPYRSFKFYGTEDKETFSRIRSQMLQSLPTPRRFVGKIYGPKGAQVRQSWHLGGMWSPNVAERWENYFGDVTHTL